MAYQGKIACFESVTADKFVMYEATGVQIYHMQSDGPISSLLARHTFEPGAVIASTSIAGFEI